MPLLTRIPVLAAAILATLPARAEAPLAPADENQRVVVADFEDVGTWRQVVSEGNKPGAWFAGVQWMGTSQSPPHADHHSGEIRFAFDSAENARGPRRVGHRRAKMSLVGGYLNGIEFDADSLGNPVSIRFVLRDRDKKSHWTPAVRLDTESGWRRHRLELTAERWAGHARVRFPAVLELVIVEPQVPESLEGRVLIDDIALTGAFESVHLASLAPIYSGISHEPGAAVVLRYRARNARAEAVAVAAGLVVRDLDGRDVFESRILDESGATPVIPARDRTTLRFDVGTLPPGGYSAEVSLWDAEGAPLAAYDDTFCVFTPNGERINKQPMWFGVQDQTLWQGEAENELHLRWMRALGIDLNRPQLTGGRFVPAVPSTLDAWRRMLSPFEEAGIDSSLLFIELPRHLWRKDGGHRSPPADYDAFERYAADLGRFIGEFPRIRYVEFWNEPEIGFFKGTIDDYWQMFRAFSRGIRATAPDVKITTGGSTVRHPREKPGFSRSLYSNHGDIYDIAAFHAHGPLDNYALNQRQVEQWQAEAGMDKPLANTESGERSGYDPAGRARQAVTLVKKMVYSKASPRSEFHVWFTLQDYWDMDPDADDSFGLVTSDNRAKPAFAAYNELIRQLANTRPLDDGSEFGDLGITGYRFVRDDGRHVLVCWASPGRSGGVFWLRSPHPNGLIERIDLFGRSERLDAALGCAIPVDDRPAYLVSDAALTLVPPEKRPLEAPAEIYRDESEPTRFTVTVRNPDTVPVSRTLALHVGGPGDNPAWTGQTQIPPAAAHDFIVTIPPVGAPPPTIGKERHVLHLSDAASQAALVSIPLDIRASHPISKIGGMGEITGLPSVRLAAPPDVTELTHDPEIPAWRGEQDLSAEGRFAHDADALLLRFDVTDDRHVQTHPDDKLWLGDSVQVAVFNPANSAHTLFDLALRGDGKADSEVVVWCHRAANPGHTGRWNGDRGVTAAIHREDGRTIYRVRVPFALLGVHPPANAASLPLRFAFLVNEDDGQGRVRWVQWHGGLGRNQDASRLGYGIVKFP